MTAPSELARLELARVAAAACTAAERLSRAELALEHGDVLEALAAVRAAATEIDAARYLLEYARMVLRRSSEAR